MQSDDRTTDPGLEHAAALKRLATVLADPHGADDLVQSTWVRVLEHGADAVRSRGAWLRQILRNEHRMAIRGRRRAQVREQAVPDDEPDDLERAAAQREVASIVAQLVDALEPEVRDVLHERYYRGHSAADIARMREIPAGTVRWRLKLGLDRLRAELDARYGGRRAMWAGAFAPLACPRTSAVIAKWVLGGLAAATAGAAAVSTTAETGETKAAVMPAEEREHVTAASNGPRMRNRGAVELAHQRWTQRREDIRGAHAQRGGDTCTDEGCLVRLATQVSELVSGCNELTSAAPPDATLRAHIIGASDIGTIVESVELGGGASLDSELGECLTQSMYMLELEAEKGDFTQDITVSLRSHADDYDRLAALVEDGELVEVDAAEVEALLAGAGLGDVAKDSKIYVMGANEPM